jgi:hypothetical protein
VPLDILELRGAVPEKRESWSDVSTVLCRRRQLAERQMKAAKSNRRQRDGPVREALPASIYAFLDRNA